MPKSQKRGLTEDQCAAISPRGWMAIEPDDGGPNHVVPVKDDRQHVVGELAGLFGDLMVKGSCWCRPKIVEGVVVHHATDHRERQEPDYGGHDLPPAQD